MVTEVVSLPLDFLLDIIRLPLIAEKEKSIRAQSEDIEASMVIISIISLLLLLLFISVIIVVIFIAITVILSNNCKKCYYY